VDGSNGSIPEIRAFWLERRFVHKTLVAYNLSGMTGTECMKTIFQKQKWHKPSDIK